MAEEKVYRTKFERMSFDFDPVIRQTADVVFRTDIPNDEDHYGAIREVAWEAMWKQNPHWQNKDLLGTIEGYAGWSSVMGGHELEEVIDVDLDFDLGVPGEGKPRLCETFKVKGRDDEKYGYRVTGFYKTFVRPKPKKKNKVLDKIMDDIIKKERADMTETQRKRKDSMIKVVQCTREEAEFVSGAGVAGTIVRIEDCLVTGIVTWEARTIARDRRNYKVIDEDWPTEMWKYWERTYNV